MTAASPARITVVVLGGGTGSEHEVSLASAAAIAAALDGERYDVIQLTIGRDGAWAQTGAAPLADDLADAVRVLSRADVAIPALHGPHGEDGTVAALLDLIGIPYVGSGVFAGAVAMDKAATKLLATEAGVATAPGIRVRSVDDPVLAELTRAGIRLPVVVKPNRAGSSHGVAVVRDPVGLGPAVRDALALDDSALVEAFVRGREIDIAVLEHADGSLQCGPALEIGVPPGGIFDTAGKYEGEPDFRVPAPLDDVSRERLEDAAMAMFRALGCRGLARVDFFVTAEGPILNEVNTFPGFTSHSQVPRMFGAAGIDYPALLDLLIDTALVRADGRRIRARV
ncbi:MAG TPA: D-alanine--D-alanine ligase [Pseudolysinimonas sp.]|nr:D-alanine--D-alanine ligase [Pseudolysinimonas sp.]